MPWAIVSSALVAWSAATEERDAQEDAAKATAAHLSSAYREVQSATGVFSTLFGRPAPAQAPNCINCGAPRQGSQCSYCKTVYRGGYRESGE